MAKKTANAGSKTIGTNVEVIQDGTKLHLIIDTDTKGWPSDSGKTTLLGSTRGNKEVMPGVYVGLNCYRYATPKKGGK